MSKLCARPDCGKTVYPIEELKCLDKTWHKQCFKCTVCGMQLNMKNYKGYEKSPYCEAHYPKTKASVVADTPEMKRLAENTKNQSLVKYHEDFEKMKGKKTELADDPETIRHLKNTQIVSQVAYHGEIDRKEQMEKIRPPAQEAAVYKMQASPTRQVGRLEDYDPLNGQFSSIVTGRAPQGAQPVYTHQPQQPQQQVPLHTSGYVPTNQAMKFNGAGAPQQHLTMGYGQQQHSPSPMGPQHSPLGGGGGQFQSPGGGGPLHYQQPPFSATSAANMSYHQSQQARRTSGGPPAGPVFQALYDYKAADTDEVTFMEGDVIVGCQRVDDGWMTGTVQRTGQWGMLPANYVERVQ